MNINIRLATPEDLSDMQNLFTKSIKSTCTKDYSPEQIQVWTSSVHNKERWEKLLSDQFVLIAENDIEMIGFGSLARGTYLDFMYVHPHYQRQGIASRIYRELKKESQKQGHHQMTADVSITAKAFFESKGFTIIKENKKHVRGIEIRNFHMSG